MEENKNLTPEIKSDKNPVKPKKLKNQAFLRKGGFSIAIIAIVLTAVVVLNVLMSVLGARFNLEFDMTSQKINSMSEENIEFLKSLENEINITFCADEETYADGYMAYYAQQYGVSEEATKYYEQTLKLIEKYTDYNKNIKLKYVDIQSTEFSAITSQYLNETIGYGDIIVTAKSGGNEKHRVVGFEDIYQISQDDTYASYGYTMSTVTGNNLETALTSAIAYVTSTKTKKMGIITGHSKALYTQDFEEMLAENNYEISQINDTLITSIPDELDVILITNPTIDFLAEEIDVISEFLDNDGKLDKGLMFFADTDSPDLPVLYDFLRQWGISVNDGVLFETNTSNHMSEDPMTMGSYGTTKDEITEDINFCLTGYNVPLEAEFEAENGITVSALVATPESVVAAPKDTKPDWTGASNYEQKSYPTVIQAVKEDYNEDNELMASYVVAFSSIEFLHSPYLSQAAVSNKDMTLKVAERIVKADETGVKFVTKQITSESYAEQVTEASSRIVLVIFMILIPLLFIGAAIFIFIIRRNA